MILKSVKQKVFNAGLTSHIMKITVDFKKELFKLIECSLTTFERLK